MTNLTNTPNDNKKTKGRGLTSFEIIVVVIFSIIGSILSYACYSRATLYEFKLEDLFTDKLCLLTFFGSIVSFGVAIYKGYPAMAPKE